MEESSTDYVLADTPPSEDRAPSTWSTIVLAVVLGVGVHSSKESLGPAEAALESVGVGPIGYAMLTTAPVALSFITPMLWGALWDRHPSLVLYGAPIGELTSAVLIALGLHVLLKMDDGIGLVAYACCGVGVLIGSACRAGITVAEFVAVGRASGSTGSEYGFTALVVAKHVNGIVMAWGVPRIIGSFDHTINGLLRVQLMTLVPHTAALIAGMCMAVRHQQRPWKRVSHTGLRDGLMTPKSSARLHRSTDYMLPASAVSGRPHSSEIELGATYDVVSSVKTLVSHGGERRIKGMMRSSSLLERMSQLMLPKQQWVVIVLLGAWRALAIGTLHAYHSVRIALATSCHGESGEATQEAGAFMAVADMFALLALVPLFFVVRRMGLRPMLVIAPLVGLTTCLVLLQHKLTHDKADFTWVQKVAVLALSLLEFASPIIPLALVPAAAGGVLGAAYGTIEGMFACVQLFITLMLGIVRDHEGGSFVSALCLLSAGFAAAALTALPLMARTKLRAAPHESGSDGNDLTGQSLHVDNPEATPLSRDVVAGVPSGTK